jgi:hypothetical protein
MHGWTQATRLKPVHIPWNNGACLFISAMDINKTGSEYYMLPACKLFNVSLTESTIATGKK